MRATTMTTSAPLAFTPEVTSIVRMTSSRTPNPAGATTEATPARKGPIQAAMYTATDAPACGIKPSASAYSPTPQATQLSAHVQTAAHIVPTVTDSRPGTRRTMMFRTGGTKFRTAGAATSPTTPPKGKASPYACTPRAVLPVQNSRMAPTATPTSP